MCLNHVDSGPLPKSIVGYKAFFRRPEGNLTPDTVGGKRCKQFNFKPGRAYVDRYAKKLDIRLPSIDEDGSYRSYPCGFHFFLTLEGAKKWIGGYFAQSVEVWKCRFSSLTAIGDKSMDWTYHKAGVARRMTLLEKVDRKDLGLC